MSYDLIITPGFGDLLFTIDSPIARAVVDVAAYPNSYIEDRSYIFVPFDAENQIDEIRLPIFFDVNNSKYEINFFDVKSNLCVLSYLPKAKMAELSKDLKFRNFASICNRQLNYEPLINLMYERLRMSAKPTKAIVKIFGNKFTEKEYATFGELFGNAWQQWKATLDNIIIVSGEDIRKYYSQDNYYSRSGSLGDSCMRYGSCQPYFDIYVDNPQVKLIVQLVNGKVAARCLLWDNKYYDRIYFIDNASQNAMTAFCNNNGYISIYRSDKTISIQLNKWDYKQYPYMDTLKYLSVGGLLTTDKKNMKLETTNGEYIEHFLCPYCKEKMHYTQRRNVYIDKDTDGFSCMDCSVPSSYIGKYILSKDAVFSVTNGSYVLKNDAVRYLSDWVHKNQIKNCTSCGTAIFKTHSSNSELCDKCKCITTNKDYAYEFTDLKFEKELDSRFYNNTTGSINFSDFLRAEARNIIIRYDDTTY